MTLCAAYIWLLAIFYRRATSDKLINWFVLYHLYVSVYFKMKLIIWQFKYSYIISFNQIINHTTGKCHSIFIFLFFNNELLATNKYL